MRVPSYSVAATLIIKMCKCHELTRALWCTLFTLSILRVGSSARNPVRHTDNSLKNVTVSQQFNATASPAEPSSSVSPVTNLASDGTKLLAAHETSSGNPGHNSIAGHHFTATSYGKPNVIFAMADDLGWGDVQYNGGNAYTPNLKRMSRSPNTILLQRHYSGGPVCSPTRGTVLTGRNHNRYCVWRSNLASKDGDFGRAQRMPLPLSEITVAEVMQKAGYSTALFGKWHLGDFKRLKGSSRKWPVSHPGLHGFDQWLATEKSAPTCTINCGCFPNSTCINGHYTNPPPCTNYYTSKSDKIEGWNKAILGGDSLFIWSTAKKFIRQQVKEKKPFFLYLPFHAVHIRYIATEKYTNLYKNHTLEEIHYYGAISEMDDVIGKLRKFLKKLGIKNNTLLWFTSDNGPKANAPGVTNGLREYKGTLYEGGVRVPGMIEWPDVITKNKESSFPVVSSDLLPTVRDILGIKPPDDRPIDGISILPFLQGKMTHRNQSIYWAYNVGGNFDNEYNVSTSGDQYKLIATYKNGTVQHYELYDLIKDVGEKTDLSKQNLSVSQKLLKEIEIWRQSVMDSAQKVGCLKNKK